MKTSTTFPRSSASRPTERRLEDARARGGPDPFAYAVLYPNRYAVGMANLGLQTVAGLLAELPGATCHRAFADSDGTLEAGRRLSDYAVVALPLSFEGDYPEALRQLAAAGIPLRSADRTPRDPLVLVGGVAPTLNPEPLAAFADVVFLGEAEVGLEALHQLLVEYRRRPREELHAALAEANLAGVYVPSRYRTRAVRGGVVREPLGAAPRRVSRAWVPVPWSPARTRILAPEDAFAGAYLLEIGRGCPHACRFCATGHLSRPARFLPAAALRPWIERGIEAAGRVGFVSAAVSDHPELEELFGAVLEQGGQFTVSSFRVEGLTEERLELLRRGGLRTLTVALEAGSQRLRRSVGKRISAEQLLTAAALAGEAGLDSLRVYAMVGLPDEQDADVTELAELCIAARRSMGRGTLTVSVSAFVPKPHTPLQWAPMAPEKVLRNRIRLLEARCGRERGVRVSAEAPKGARVQGLLSRGGREVGTLLERAAADGNWRRVLQSDAARRVLDRERDLDEPLPWDFITGTPSRDHLQREWAAAREGASVIPCRPGECRVCGVCTLRDDGGGGGGDGRGAGSC